MAIIDLGKVSITWRGTYAGGTAYTPKDAVVYNNASYICIANTTGNLPTDTTYWNVMAAKGVDGTDVGTTLTTQGDILYRDGSGLQRLAAGTAGQVLQTGGSGANVSWTTMSSDMVKIVTATGGGTTALALDSCFSADYENYLIVANLYASGGTLGAYIRIQNASNTEQNSGNYRYAATQIYKNSGANATDIKTGWNTGEISMQENVGTDTGHFASFKIYVAKPFVSDSYTNFVYDFVSFDNTYLRSVRGTGMYAVAQRNAGFRFSSSNSNTFSSASKVTVYGLKD